MSDSPWSRRVPVRRGHMLVGTLVATLLLLALALVTGSLGIPSITDTDNRIEGGNDTATVLRSEVTVTNPNPVTVPPGEAVVTYAVFANGEKLGEGTVEGVRFRPGDTTVTVRTPIANRRLAAWLVDHVDNGERTDYTVVRTVRDAASDRELSRSVTARTLETNITGALTTTEPRPVSPDLPGASGTLLYINGTNARWGSVTGNRTILWVNATVHNPTADPLPVENATFDVFANGIRLANGSTGDVGDVPPREERTVTARFVVNNDRIDDWWGRHVRCNQTSAVRVESTVRLGRGGFRLTASPPPLERTVHTDVFGATGDRFQVTDTNSSVVADCARS